MRLVILLVVVFCSCSKEKILQPQSARVNLSTDPTALDPRRTRDLPGITLISMLFEGLTRISQNGDVDLAIADKVDVDETGRQFTFHLRKSNWSNGDPLTAFDFSTSWKSILDPHFASDIAHYLYPIKNAREAKLGEAEMDAVGIKVLDELTLSVELERPVPYFLKLLALPVFFPVPSKIALANEEWCNRSDTFVGNGPFVLTNWKHADSLHFSKNSLYWEKSAVRLPSIDFLIATPDTALQMFEEGKLDWGGSPLSLIPADAVENLKNAKRLETSPFLATAFYRVNTAPEIKGKPNPLCNAPVRRALAYAIDRKQIVSSVLPGGQTVARGLVPPQMGLQADGYFEDGKEEVFEPFEEPVTLSYLNSERNAAVAQIVKNQWENTLHIKVQLEAIEPKTFFQRVSKGEYQIAAGSWTADFDDPINFLEVFKHKDGGVNNTGWENEEYIDLLNRSYICKDGNGRDGCLRQAEQILMQEMPIIPVFHFSLSFVKNPQLSGVVLSPFGRLDLRWAWFEPVGEKK